MSAVALVLDIAAVALLVFIAQRVHGLSPGAAPSPTDPKPSERIRPMSLSDQERHRHGLALVRRTIASGKHTKADVARWKEEFGPKPIAELLEDAKPEPSPPSSGPKSKE